MPKPFVIMLTAASGISSPNNPRMRSGNGTVLTNGLARISTTGAQLDISRRCTSCRDIPKK